ncbi:hypothetical protein UFOVP187_21 [uncultured Caudovirales phage]|uniref:Uncharacterized protein n=1 Tax=uncultured Caudovirales phage TaxID=2100421 RepID=A0A6J7WIP9_9CAUD|nr:hypothetical protein UFOVP187_21 [uncultured Caudovirales phage]
MTTLKNKIKEIETYHNKRELLNDKTIRKNMNIRFKSGDEMNLDIDFEDNYWMEPRDLKIYNIRMNSGEIRGTIDYGKVDKFGSVILNFFFNTDGLGFIWDWTREDGENIPYSGFIETALNILKENTLLNK